MSRRGVGTVIVASFAWLPLAAPAAEMIVQGEVIDVVPVAESTARPAAPAVDCHPAKPRHGANLLELLEWDLRVRCPAPAGTASAYRVYYRWDGRTYSRIMREPPGETVSLRVRVR
jgi:hypothetical protein